MSIDLNQLLKLLPPLFVVRARLGIVSLTAEHYAPPQRTLWRIKEKAVEYLREEAHPVTVSPIEINSPPSQQRRHSAKQRLVGRN